MPSQKPSKLPLQRKMHSVASIMAVLDLSEKAVLTEMARGRLKFVTVGPRRKASTDEQLDDYIALLLAEQAEADAKGINLTMGFGQRSTPCT